MVYDWHAMKNNTLETTPEEITFDIELTDTFGGEANYCWVRRATLKAPATISDRSLVRRAKEALGLHGPHKKENMGETIALRPVGACIICFIKPQY